MTKLSDISVTVMQVGFGANDYEINAIVSDPDEMNALRVDKFNEMSSLMEPVIGILCNGTYWLHIMFYCKM